MTGKLFHVYTVQQVNGPWLLLKVEGTGIRGWVAADQVVLFENAIDYFTAEIRRNPSSASAYNRRGLIWHEKGEYDIALADYNEVIRLIPELAASAYNNRGNAWQGKQEYDRAIDDYTEAIRLDPKDALAYNNRAWLWATCPDEAYRDGQRAVESATKACELSDWKDPNSLDTLAAAHAEVGDFKQAVKWQEKAVELAAPDAKDDFRERLELYRSGQPYREVPQPSAREARERRTSPAAGSGSGLKRGAKQPHRSPPT